MKKWQTKRVASELSKKEVDVLHVLIVVRRHAKFPMIIATAFQANVARLVWKEWTGTTSVKTKEYLATVPIASQCQFHPPHQKRQRR